MTPTRCVGEMKTSQKSAAAFRVAADAKPAAMTETTEMSFGRIGVVKFKILVGV